MSDAHRPRVAIVGGGITGAVAASRLAFLNAAEITLFDQGRRGPGGRASHRAVDSKKAVLPDDPPIALSSLEFDHGCQFFRADDERMRLLAATWCAKGWAAEWKGRFGSVGDGPIADFFGLPSHKSAVYIGVGGMHALPRRILDECGVNVQRGVRVAGMRREADGKWALLGVSWRRCVPRHERSGGQGRDPRSPRVVRCRPAHRRLVLFWRLASRERGRAGGLCKPRARSCAHPHVFDDGRVCEPSQPAP